MSARAIILAGLSLLPATGAPVAAGGPGVPTPAAAADTLPARGPEPPGPTPGDLVTVTRIERLELSAGGQHLLVIGTRRPEPDADRRRFVERIDLSDGGRRAVSLPDGAEDLAWRPGTGVLSYVAARDGPPQVWLDPPHGEPTAVTRHERGVADYRWGPDGRRLAFTSHAPAGGDAEGSHATGQGGVEVDPASFRVYDLFRDELPRPGRHVRSELWVLEPGEEPTKVSGDLSVSDYAWSPGAGRLAFTARAELGSHVWRRDLHVWSAAEGTVRTLAQGRSGEPFRGPGRLWEGAVSLEDPVWGPGGRRVAFERTDHGDGYASLAEVAVVDVASGRVRDLTDRDRTDLYGPRLTWPEPDRLLLVNTADARRGLFWLSAEGGRPSEHLRSDAFRSEFAFSAGADTVAWVEEASDRPPEVHVRPGRDAEPRRVTDYNAGLADRWLPEARAVTWTSADGTEVEGWLLLPRGHDPDRDRRPPLLVVLHGGPSYPVTDRVLPYPYWPYPYPIFADRGYAIFFPNYRGTHSYGRAFRNPTERHREPVQDVLTGVDALVDRGLADSARVGIMGHSYGAWLGPMVVARRPEQFAAAAFAEGGVDQVSRYAQMDGWLTSNFDERQHWMGATLYEDPAAYLEMSPIFYEGVRETPTLVEAGQESLAVQGMEYAKALWREGTPHEFVIYPDAGHNLEDPALMMDAMRRSLAWFRRWIEPGVEGAAAP